MAAFEYAALDAEGRRKRGVLDGDTARHVRQQLRDRGWNPLQVEAVAEHPSPSRLPSGTRPLRGIGPFDLALLTRQLATLVHAGLPLERALDDVARQSRKTRVERTLLAVRARVREGHTLANALGRFPHVFPDLYRRTVAAGEHSGHLGPVLERLADFTERQQQLRQKTLLALFYPALLTTVALAVVMGLVTYVVPQVVQVFNNMGQQLPWITVALIATSAFLRSYGLVLLGVVLGAAVAVAAVLRRPGPRRRWQQLLLRLPLLGALVRGANAARFARTLSILAASSVPILDALQVAGQVLGNLPIRKAVETAARQVREGSALHSALQQSGHFPPMMLSLIGSGEASGNLEQMLERAAVMQEREVESAVAVLMSVFEPLLILIMGAVVLVIVLAILLPIFQLNQLVS